MCREICCVLSDLSIVTHCTVSIVAPARAPRRAMLAPRGREDPRARGAARRRAGGPRALLAPNTLSFSLLRIPRGLRARPFADVFGCQPENWLDEPRWGKALGRTPSVGAVAAAAAEGAATRGVAEAGRAAVAGGAAAATRSLQHPLLLTPMQRFWPTSARLSLTGKPTKRRSATQCRRSA
eukprot:COSAG03_NODE_582_length_6866_cov_9.299985_2_plen_181_part_00